MKDDEAWKFANCKYLARRNYKASSPHMSVIDNIDHYTAVPCLFELARLIQPYCPVYSARVIQLRRTWKCYSQIIPTWLFFICNFSICVITNTAEMQKIKPFKLRSLVQSVPRGRYASREQPFNNIQDTRFFKGRNVLGFFCGGGVCGWGCVDGWVCVCVCVDKNILLMSTQHFFPIKDFHCNFNWHFLWKSKEQAYWSK